jgi:hypothetical protein
MPFSLEGFAFFTEAIFLGIYLYGWNRVSPVLHWLAGIVVAVSGICSAVFVVLANSWMNAPVGFDVVNGQAVNINPIAAMLNPAFARYGGQRGPGPGSERAEQQRAPATARKNHNQYRSGHGAKRGTKL